MKMAVEEAAQVAEALGIRLLYDHPAEKVAGVCEATAGNIASMLQDILKEKRTEIEQINGAVVRETERTGIPTPQRLAQPPQRPSSSHSVCLHDG